MKAFFYAALLCGVANTALADPPSCWVNSAPSTYGRSVCVQPHFSHDDSDDAKDYEADHFMYMFQPEIGTGTDKYGRGTWRRVPKSGEAMPGNGHCDNGVMVRQSGRLQLVGYDSDNDSVCRWNEMDYTITSPAPRPVVAKATKTAAQQLDADAIAAALAKLGTEVNKHTDEQVGGLRTQFNGRFDTMARTQATTDEGQNTRLGRVEGRVDTLDREALRSAQESDQDSSFQIGAAGLSVQNLGSGAVGLVQVHGNRHKSLLNWALRVSGGALEDGQEWRGVLGMDLGTNRPLFKKGSLLAGASVGWLWMFSEGRIADYPHLNLDLNYRLSSAVAAMAAVQFGIVINEEVNVPDTGRHDLAIGLLAGLVINLD